VSSEQNSMLLPERVKLVIALTEVNSRYLRGENRCAGAEIELACALACEKRDGATPDRTRDIAQLRARMDASETELMAIEAERDWLENELASFDTPASSRQPGAWQ
jgi:hypothetical protein